MPALFLNYIFPSCALVCLPLALAPHILHFIFIHLFVTSANIYGLQTMGPALCLLEMRVIHQLVFVTVTFPRALKNMSDSHEQH